MNKVLGRIGGKASESSTTIPIRDKFSNEIVGELHTASLADIDEALTQASTAAVTDPLTSHQRATILRKAAQLIGERAEEFAAAQTIEAGFTVADGRVEVERARETLMLSADAAINFCGQAVPLGSAPGARNRTGLTIRKPFGVVGAITPFNSPVNTPAHKVGPAIAAGNAVVLKPAENTPTTGSLLADALYDAGLPTTWLHVIHGEGASVGSALVADERTSYVAFTGSTATGTAIQKAVGLRRTQLELGAISCTVISEDADLSDTTFAKCANSAFRKAGQVCTSIQRIYVHRDIAEEATAKLLAATAAVVTGNPADPTVQCGPLITLAAAERVESWIHEAVTAGAELLSGGNRENTVIHPTVLRGVTPGMKLHDLEAFGPVVCVYVYDTDEELISEINSTQYGLAAGLFTNSLDRVMNFAYKLDMGTLHVNGTSSNRVDIMPYGGLKASGHGTEGPAYAVLDMSQETLVSFEWHG